MKRASIVFSVLLFLLCGCSAAEKPAEISKEISPLETAAEAEQVNPVPALPDTDVESVPKQLIFREIAEYIVFKESIDLSDEEFERFIQENSYNMNGIRSKEDADELIEKLEAMTVPMIENTEIVGMTIAVETGYCTVRQKSDSNTVYHVRINLEGENPHSIDSVNKIKINTENEDELYYFENQNDQHHQFEGIIDGNYIFIWVNNIEKSIAEENISNVTFTSLSNLIQ